MIVQKAITCLNKPSLFISFITAHQLKCHQCKGSPIGLGKLQDMLPNATAAYQKSGGVGLCDGESTGESTQCNLMDWKKYANKILYHYFLYL